jgi:hypothetical protein
MRTGAGHFAPLKNAPRCVRVAGLPTRMDEVQMTADDDEPFKMGGEPAKPYVLYRIGANDEIIERIAEGDSVEDLYKAHRRRLDWKYAIYHNRQRLAVPREGY